jgi:hypothetical protein
MHFEYHLSSTLNVALYCTALSYCVSFVMMTGMQNHSPTFTSTRTRIRIRTSHRIDSLQSRQVPASEVGALQGAADTIRTVSGMLGAPLVSRALARCIAPGSTQPPGRALQLAASFSMLAFLLLVSSGEGG